jgi:hypothetical protein
MESQPEQAVKALQAYLRKLVPAGLSRADAIIPERRDEAAPAGA